MVRVWENAPNAVCKLLPSNYTARQTDDQKLARLDDEHGDLMSALLARVGGTATTNDRTDSLTIVHLDF